MRRTYSASSGNECVAKTSPLEASARADSAPGGGRGLGRLDSSHREGVVRRRDGSGVGPVFLPGVAVLYGNAQKRPPRAGPFACVTPAYAIPTRGKRPSKALVSRPLMISCPPRGVRQYLAGWDEKESYIFSAGARSCRACCCAPR